MLVKVVMGARLLTQRDTGRGMRLDDFDGNVG